MPLGNNDFFGLDSLLNAEVNNFFVSTDIRTVLGKNIVLNFLGKIEFEIRNLGFSDTANDIADFYEKCKSQNGGIIEFFTNPVVKMILSEIQSMPTLRNYLKKRIFDEIEIDKAKDLDRIFNNNEDILKKQEQERKEFLKEKEMRRKKLKQIAQKHDCTLEQAENILKQQESLQKDKELNKILDESLSNLLNMPIPKTYKTVIDKNGEAHFINVETEEIELDEDFTEDINTSSDDTFWS